MICNMSGKVRTFNPYVLLIVLSLGFIMAVLDTTGVVLSIPMDFKWLHIGFKYFHIVVR